MYLFDLRKIIQRYGEAEAISVRLEKPYNQFRVTIIPELKKGKSHSVLLTAADLRRGPALIAQRLRDTVRKDTTAALGASAKEATKPSTNPTTQKTTTTTKEN